MKDKYMDDKEVACQIKRIKSYTFQPLFISNLLQQISPLKLVGGLFLGYKDVNEFVDKAMEEALNKEKGKGGDAYE